MSIRRLALFLSCLFGMAPLLNAAVLERDFLAPGDGLLTYDDVNHREWLDLTETLDWSLTELHQAVAPHGPLQGFSIATVEDLTGLATSAGVEWLRPDQLFPAVPGESASNLIDLVGVLLDYSDPDSGVSDDPDSADGGFILFSTFSGYGTAIDFDDLHVFNILEVLGLRAAGGLIVNDLAGGMFEPHSYSLASVFSYPHLAPGAINRPLGGIDLPRGGITLYSQPLSEPIVGSFWLYRAAIPEPSSLALLLLGSSVLLLRSRNQMEWR